MSSEEIDISEEMLAYAISKSLKVKRLMHKFDNEKATPKELNKMERKINRLIIEVCKNGSKIK